MHICMLSRLENLALEIILLRVNRNVRFCSKLIVRFLLRPETATGGSPKPFPGAAPAERSYATALISGF